MKVSLARIAGISRTVGVLFLLAAFGLPMLYHVWGFCVDEADVRSGRIRENHYALGLRFRRLVRETDFSREAARLSLVHGPPDWRFAGGHTVGLRHRLGWVTYVCGTYGGALADCHNLMLEFALTDADDVRRKEEIGLFLKLMQERRLGDMGKMLQERYYDVPDN